MAVVLRFINVIIPIENIEKCKSIGGFAGIKNRNKDFIGDRIYFDNYLYRDGAMNPYDAEEIVKFWKKSGLKLFKVIDGEKHWNDLCVVEGLFGGPTLPCDWLEFGSEDGLMYTYLKDKPKGEIVG